MKLGVGQTAILNNFIDFLALFINKDTDHIHKRRQLIYNETSLFRIDIPWTFPVKDKTQGIHPRLDGTESIFWPCIPA
jgi:hypothetical protein